MTQKFSLASQFRESMVNFEPDSDSCSRSIKETVNGSHNFMIKGYSLAKGMRGSVHSKRHVTVGGYDWAVYFYPDGKNAEDGSIYVSAFIALASEGSDLRALFELTLKLGVESGYRPGGEEGTPPNGRRA